MAEAGRPAKPTSPAGERLPDLADPALIREPPATSRGVRTRAALVRAARTVFERDGYIDARLADITAEAGCSAGTLYLYFLNKEEIFNAVLESVEDDMLHPGFGPHADLESDPYAVIEASNRAYLEAYRRNARLMALLTQVSTVNARFRRARAERSRAFVERNARSLRRLQQRGMADPSLDPLLTALMLSAMVSRTAYEVFCIDETPPPIDQLVDYLTRLWTNAIHLEATPQASTTDNRRSV